MAEPRTASPLPREAVTAFVAEGPAAALVRALEPGPYRVRSMGDGRGIGEAVADGDLLVLARCDELPQTDHARLPDSIPALVICRRGDLPARSLSAGRPWEIRQVDPIPEAARAALHGVAWAGTLGRLRTDVGRAKTHVLLRRSLELILDGPPDDGDRPMQCFRRLQDVAARLGCRPGLLSRLAHDNGLALAPLLRCVLLAHALQEKHGSRHPWHRVARVVGFSSSPAWTGFVKRLVGVPPSQLDGAAERWLLCELAAHLAPLNESAET